MGNGKIDWKESPAFGRRVTLEHVLEMLHERRAEGLAGAGAGEWPAAMERVPLIVEVGTSESYNPNGLGNALLAFAWYTYMYGGRVKSVDVRLGAVKNSREILRRYAPSSVMAAEKFVELPEITCADVFDWAPGIQEPIDLLYVDAGYEIETDPDYAAFVRRHPEIPSNYVEMFQRFRPECFGTGALCLFDDTSPDTFAGKGQRLIPYMLARGWRKVEVRGVPVFPMCLLEKI